MTKWGKRFTLDDLNRLPAESIKVDQGKGFANVTVNQKYDIIIGIDAGVETGYAVWDAKNRSFIEISTLKIHEAMQRVKDMQELGVTLFLRVEDARLRKWFGNSGKEKLQGAGSVKRDCKIWEDYLTDLGIEFEMVAPKDNKTKLDKKQFKSITKYQGSTSVHGRDAGMLVFGM